MKGLLKFITCGSVDDGKSTLIGHMLYDAKLLFSDQKQSLELDSKVGSRGGAIDYSLLLDGLMAEREQGITIDVAYRYFTTEKRSFIVADTPGHEEYTRNMAVGASFAKLAVILVDASQGILIQTRRHARICALMGIRYFVFAVNKMDLLQYRAKRFRSIEKDIRKLAIDLDLEHIQVIPVSATEGDNVTHVSSKMAWYCGPTLLSYLEDVDVEEFTEEGFLMPVQRVCRPDRRFRGFQGEIESGTVCVGDQIVVLPSGEQAKVTTLLVAGKAQTKAGKGQPITLSLDREVDVSRGCVLVRDTRPSVANMFTAEILWMDDQTMVEGKSFSIKIGTKQLPASIMQIKYKVDVVTGEHVSAKEIYKNELAVCDVVLSENAVFDVFSSHQAIGCFILVDRITNMTSACGVIKHPLRRAENLLWQESDITRQFRADRMNQRPMTLWFTGLSGAGKSTIANALEKQLYAQGYFTMLLDGDNVRMGLNRDLGFEQEGRIENIRRVAEVAKLMNDAGLIVLTAFISPFASDRQNAREIIGEDSFTEVFVNTSLEACEARDVKGLYRKARENKIPNFTGINSPYERPEHPDITVNTEQNTVQECVEHIIKVLEVKWRKTEEKYHM